MSSSTPKSRPMSKEEAMRLVELVAADDIITSKVTNALNNKLKEESWVRLTDSFNASVSNFPRATQQLRLKWENLKKSARKRAANIRRSRLKTEGGKEYFPPDEVLDKVASLLGIVETRKTKNTLAEILTPDKEEEIIIKDEFEEEHFHFQGDLGAEENTIDDAFANPNFSSDANTPITNSDKRSSKKRPLGEKDEPYRKKEAIADVVHINGAMNALRDKANSVENYSGTIDEFEVFGRTVAAHLRQLPLNEALESQSEILSYLVQRRLGRKKNLYS